MLKNGYRYALMFYRDGEAPMGQAAVEVDWGAVREWAEFSAIRRGLLSAGEAGKTYAVRPRWHPRLGEPYVEGFRVDVEAGGACEASIEFGTTHFRKFAKRASAALVERGALKKGERFKYVAAAFPQPERPPDSFRFTAESSAPQLSLKETPLAQFVRDSNPAGEPAPDDMPLFIPQRVLDEAAELSKGAGAKETGGVLIGHLHRDAGLPEVFAEVTAQIPARHTEANLTKLTFTSETWTDVRAALALRRRDEIMLGWWHSHPLREWCKGCSAESQRACAMARDFFSAHDHALHRTIFPRAYSVALVVNDLPSGEATFSVFGWRRGLLEPRGFRVAGEGQRLQTETNAARSASVPAPC